jgi:putative flippase GtrA
LAMQGSEFGYAGYWDADLATPLDAVEVFVSVLNRLPAVDVVFGTRVALLGRQIERLAIRHYLGRVFATAASLVLALPIYDTQCGAKLFRVNERCASLFAAPFGSRWIFDVELVARYLLSKRATAGESTSAVAARNIGIYELPLDRWQDVGASKVKPLDFVRAIGEMAMIYRTYRSAESKNQHWLLALAMAPFVRYAGAGAIGTAVHYGVLIGAVNLARVSPASGTALGAGIGALVNYFLNYNLTFASKQPHRQTLPRFLIVAALGALISWVMIKVLGERGAHYIAAQFLGTILVLVGGYALNKTWTFKTSRS